MADVVLPVTQWAEEEGTMTTLEGRVVRRRKAIDPPGEARSELWLWAELARALRPPPGRRRARGLRRAGPGLRRWPRRLLRVTYDRLDAGEALFWPCSTAVPEGTPRLFLDGFPTADGRAHLVAVEHHGPADDVTSGPARPPRDRPRAAPLPVGRADPPRRRAASRPHPSRSPSCTRCSPTGSASPTGMPCASPPPAAPSSRPPPVTDGIRPDTVFLPFHWAGDLSANLLTNDATDPVSGMPEFKVCAVRSSGRPSPSERRCLA